MLQENARQLSTPIPLGPWRPLLRGAVLVLAAVVVGLVVVVFIAYLDVSYRYRSHILSPDRVDPRPTAIVFGAGVYPGGRLSPVLVDRMRTAIALYQEGKVDKLLLTGDNSSLYYNEPGHMGEYARSQGVPESALAYDYAGRRTYDSCWRARHIFGQERVILVTQDFHLPRALYLCQQFGVDAVGVAADRRNYAAASWWTLRESIARVAAWFDVHFLRPQPVAGESINIFAPDYIGRIG